MAADGGAGGDVAAPAGEDALVEDVAEPAVDEDCEEPPEDVDALDEVGVAPALVVAGYATLTPQVASESNGPIGLLNWMHCSVKRAITP